MQGLHLTADLYQCRCDPAWLEDAQQLGAWCLASLREAGLTPVAQLFEADPSENTTVAGAVVTVLLPGSHLLLRTWPAQRGVTVDLYAAAAGGTTPEAARALVDTLAARFQPTWTEQRSLDRGDEQ